MKFTINSRKFKQKITFSRPGQGYIFVDLNGQPGTLGRQICDGGYLMGGTLAYYGDDQTEFEAICKRWWKAYLRNYDHMY